MKKSLSLLGMLLLIIIVYSSFYTVIQGEQAIRLRLGKIVTNAQQQVIVDNPGLHFKWPLIEQVRWFDTRLQTLNVDSSRILTLEQKYVLVDYYAKWRINNIALYYTRTGGDATQARLLLRQKINDSLRGEFGRRNLSDVISDARTAIMQKLQTQANASAQALGITVTDVRIKRIDLPEEVSNSVFARMRAERELVAARHRSNGKAIAEKIRAQADADATVLVAQAQANAARTRADGEAKAAKIYADVYNKNPSFYAFYRSLQAYQTIFNSPDNLLVLNANNKFFHYFNETAAEQIKHD